MLHRRAFLTGLIAAPAVVAAGSLMKIRGVPLVVSYVPEWKHFNWIVEGQRHPHRVGIWMKRLDREVTLEEAQKLVRVSFDSDRGVAAITYFAADLLTTGATYHLDDLTVSKLA